MTVPFSVLHVALAAFASPYSRGTSPAVPFPTQAGSSTHLALTPESLAAAA